MRKGDIVKILVSRPLGLENSPNCPIVKNRIGIIISDDEPDSLMVKDTENCIFVYAEDELTEATSDEIEGAFERLLVKEEFGND